MRPRPDRFSFPSNTHPGQATVVERKPDGEIRITSASDDRRFLAWGGSPEAYKKVRELAFALLELTEPMETDDAHDTPGSPP